MYPTNRPFSVGPKERERGLEQKRKKSEEYLMVNFPADVRKNLRGIVLPEDEEEGTRGEAKCGEGMEKKKKEKGKTSEGTLDNHCTAQRERELTQTQNDPPSV